MRWKTSYEWGSTQKDGKCWQYVGTLYKGSLKDFLVSLMRWIGNYAWEEDCASQTDALQACSDPTSSYNQMWTRNSA